jgi:hypothetical protein
MPLLIGPVSSMGTPPSPVPVARDLAAEMLKIIQTENARGLEIRPATMQIGCDGQPNINALDGTACNGDPNGPLVLINPQTRSVFTAYVGRPFVGTQGLGTIDRTVLSPCEQEARRLRMLRRFVDNMGNVYDPDGTFLYDGATPAWLNNEFSYNAVIGPTGEKSIIRMDKLSTPTAFRTVSGQPGGTPPGETAVYSQAYVIPSGGGFPSAGTYTLFGGASRGGVTATDATECTPQNSGIVLCMEAKAAFDDGPGGTYVSLGRTNGSHAMVTRQDFSLGQTWRKPLAVDGAPNHLWATPQQFSVSANKEGLYFVQLWTTSDVVTVGGHTIGEEFSTHGTAGSPPNPRCMVAIRVNPSTLEPMIVERVVLNARTGSTFAVATSIVP